MFYNLHLDPDTLATHLAAIGFRAESAPSAGTRRFRRRTTGWNVSPNAVIDLVPAVGGTNAHVQLRTSPRWLTVAAGLFIAVVLALRWSYRFGPVDAGYAVASSRFFAWPESAVALGVTAAFASVVVWLAVSRVKLQFELYSALRLHAPPN